MRTSMRIGRRDAATMNRILRAIGRQPAAASTMDRRDVEKVARAFRAATRSRSVDAQMRDACRYWAAYLEGRPW